MASRHQVVYNLTEIFLSELLWYTVDQLRRFHPSYPYSAGYGCGEWTALWIRPCTRYRSWSRCTGSQPTGDKSFTQRQSAITFRQAWCKPSQPKSITAPWPVPSYTAWWQMHIRKGKGKEEYLYSTISYTMYISKCSGMDHSFTCKYTMPAFPS